MLDPTEFGKAMAAIVRDAQAPLLKRIEQLEARQPERGEKGEPGKDAPVPDSSEISTLLWQSESFRDLLKSLVAEMPKPIDGKDGRDGKDAVGLTGERGEKGEPGERGNPGEKGDSGAAGRDADPIDVKEIVSELLSGNEIKALVDLHVAESVQKHFEENPVQHGKDGKDGRDGKDGERGGIGETGQKGDSGADGIGLAGAIIDREGCLTITTTKGAPINLGCVVGKDGELGKDGADFTDAAIDYDGERGLIIRGNGGEIVKRLPIPMDKGYWREGMDCEKADILTHNGNAWIALRDTKAKPCHENTEDWRMFARGGRNGIDGRAGRDLGTAQPVKLNGNA